MIASAPAGWMDSQHQLASGNALAPGLMSARERIAEIAEILALGLIRLRARQSSSLSADPGDSSLAFPPHRSGHACVLKTRRGTR